jgi:hypothetical protein
MKKSKKAQIGLNTVQGVLLALLVITVLAVTMAIAMVSLIDVTDDRMTTTTTLANITTSSVVNETGAFPTGITVDTRNCVLTVTSVVNSSGRDVGSGNYSTSACEILCDGCGAFNNTAWFITGSYVFADPEPSEMLGNITDANQTFFSNTGTLISILVAVVIILTISIILFAVRKFGGTGGI